MSRVIAIDYGLKRCGLAITDPQQLIATGLATIETPGIISFLKNYFNREVVELILLGDPKNLNNTDTDITAAVRKFALQLAATFPGIPVKLLDERFTSKMASRAISQMGLNKKQRRDKALVDEVAATILLQGYLESAGFDNR